jgi:type IV secretion system protein VirB10
MTVNAADQDRKGHAETVPVSDDGTKKRALIACGVAGVAAVAVFGFSMLSPAKKPIAEKNTRVQSMVVVEKTPEPPMARLVPLSATMPAVPQDRPQLQVGAVDTMLESARRAPVVAYKRQVPELMPAAEERPDAHSGLEADDKGLFERRLRPPRLEGVSARLIGDRRFIVAQGTSIMCTLETALQSDQAGFTACIVSRDVLSDNGEVVLMEKGTQITGEYRGGMQQGQVRLHVLWSRAKTPEGVVVELASPGTDALGRAGFGGHVDNHWWERFGSALLLSTVSDATKAGIQRVQANTGGSINGVGNSGKEAAALAVEQAAAIKPTLHKNQGDVVSIFVARDLDFSSVYKLAVLRPGSQGRLKEPLFLSSGNGQVLK